MRSSADSAIGKERAKSFDSADYKAIVTAVIEINKTGPRFIDFKIGHDGMYQFTDSYKPKEDLRAVRDALKEAGYDRANKGKLIGASETYEFYKHHSYPNHQYVVNVRSYTRGGQKRARIKVSVEPV